MTRTVRYVAPRDADHWQLVPVPKDSTGRVMVSDSAMMHGSMNHCLLAVRDSRAQRADLELINDREKVRAQNKAESDAFDTKRADLQAYADSVAADVEAVRDVLMQEFVGKLDALAARMDSLEARRANDPDDDDEHALSPGIQPRTPAAMED
jgi:molecular chaperone GrpE (heat shock protein)